MLDVWSFGDLFSIFNSRLKSSGSFLTFFCCCCFYIVFHNPAQVGRLACHFIPFSRR